MVALSITREQAQLLRDALYQYRHAFYIGMGPRPWKGKEGVMDALLAQLDKALAEGADCPGRGGWRPGLPPDGECGIILRKRRPNN